MWITKSTYEKLNNRLDELNKRVWELENPKKFEAGDKVYYKGLQFIVIGYSNVREAKYVDIYPDNYEWAVFADCRGSKTNRFVRTYTIRDLKNIVVFDDITEDLLSKKKK